MKRVAGACVVRYDPAHADKTRLCLLRIEQQLRSLVP
jgi:hypothetical protein